MKKISLIYHSGVGNTKLIASIMKRILEKANFAVYFKSVEEKIDGAVIAESFALILGFPTYHAALSTSMKQYLEHNTWLTTLYKPYFVYTTYGLYPANSLRTFAKLLKEQHLFQFTVASIEWLPPMVFY